MKGQYNHVNNGKEFLTVKEKLSAKLGWSRIEYSFRDKQLKNVLKL